MWCGVSSCCCICSLALLQHVEVLIGVFYHGVVNGGGLCRTSAISPPIMNGILYSGSSTDGIHV